MFLYYYRMPIFSTGLILFLSSALFQIIKIISGIEHSGQQDGREGDHVSKELGCVCGHVCGVCG